MVSKRRAKGSDFMKILVTSSEKIKSELGWKPQFAELDKIIASAWEWHQRRYS